MTGMRSGAPRFVSLDEATAMHEIALVAYGGLAGVRDRTLLESALAQPQQSIGGSCAYEHPYGIAAAYIWFIAKNHPFLDGNKRTALACAVFFLSINGYDFLGTGEQAANAVLDVLSGAMTRDSLADWLGAHSRRRQ